MPALKLQVIAAIAAWVTAATCLSIPAAAIPRHLAAAACTGFCPRDDDYAKLGASLSPGAHIYFPGSPEFVTKTTRWSNLASPKVNVVVVPGNENDVSLTVKYANKKALPFLAYNTAHGALTTLGRMDHGIEIDITSLNSIKIAADGKTARVGGGVRSKDLTDALWAANKQTVTGTCECVSMMGPALGGGHGWLQGYYGLVADQILSFNVVLADGKSITVDASSDLFYGLKGAGHNFGIVTSIVTKIYDVKFRNWAIETLIFSGDKVEKIYQAANDYLLKNGTQSKDLINWSYWLNSPDLDPNNPIVIFYIIQQGVSAVDTKYTQAFHDIGPLVIQPQAGTYLDVSGWAGVAETAPPCQKAGLANPRFPIYLQQYNPAAMKQAYAQYAAAVTPSSSPFYGSIFMFEGYPVQGMAGVDPASTAFAHRDQRLLNAPLIQYDPAAPGGLDARARKLGNDLRDVLQRGSGRPGLAPAYVNYGYGDEDQTQYYGADPARIQKLCALKQKYDPNGRFSFYAPVKCGSDSCTTSTKA